MHLAYCGAKMCIGFCVFVGLWRCHYLWIPGCAERCWGGLPCGSACRQTESSPGGHGCSACWPGRGLLRTAAPHCANMTFSEMVWDDYAVEKRHMIHAPTFVVWAWPVGCSPGLRDMVRPAGPSAAEHTPLEGSLSPQRRPCWTPPRMAGRPRQRSDQRILSRTFPAPEAGRGGGGDGEGRRVWAGSWIIQIHNWN